MSRQSSPSRAGRSAVRVALTLIAAGLLLASLKLPLWQMRMEAPQYRDEEALRVHVFAGKMAGDLRELAVLNQYIGVHVPEVLPQSRWLPWLLVGGAALGLVGSVLPRIIRRCALFIAPVVLATGLAVACVQARQQMHDIGHERDARTTLAGVRDFDPPFLGTTKIAQFTVSSWFGAGAYLVGAAITLQLIAALSSRRKRCGANCQCGRSQNITPESSEVLV